MKEKVECEREVLTLEKEKDEIEDFGKGLEEYNRKMQEKKNAAKIRIMDMIGKKGRISNRDVASVLGITSRTATRYLDELEEEGLARQVGKTGKSVFYSKQ